MFNTRRKNQSLVVRCGTSYFIRVIYLIYGILLLIRKLYYRLLLYSPEG